MVGLSGQAIDLLIMDGILELGVLVTVETDSVPGEVEEAVHALEVAAAGLGHEPPDPDTADDGDGREAPEGAHGRDAAFRYGKQHVRHRARVAVLVREVQRHRDRRRQRPNPERE